MITTKDETVDPVIVYRPTLANAYFAGVVDAPEEATVGDVAGMAGEDNVSSILYYEANLYNALGSGTAGDKVVGTEDLNSFTQSQTYALAGIDITSTQSGWTMGALSDPEGFPYAQLKKLKYYGSWPIADTTARQLTQEATDPTDTTPSESTTLPEETTPGTETKTTTPATIPTTTPSAPSGGIKRDEEAV
jgi:hypothetical protein